MLTDTLLAVAQYAARLHATARDRHHVASPLGAWLLLAICGRAATGPERHDLAAALGTDVDHAYGAARELLDDPHPLVAAGTALWHRPGVETPALLEWSALLPAATQRGPLPEQDELDAWARDRTYGLVQHFPLEVDPSTVLVFASALATRVTWRHPFEVAAGSTLGRSSPWTGMRHVLRSPERGHRSWIAATGQSGDVAVHAADAVEATTDEGRVSGLRVMSVVAGRDVAPIDVVTSAYELVADLDEWRPRSRRSLFDLELGEHELWSLREGVVELARQETEWSVATLPCWSASAFHDLTPPELGLDAAARALSGKLDRTGLDFGAKQTAVARFSRYGFEAAAITGGYMPTSGPSPVLARVAELRFAHPYAVVAVTTDRRPDGTPGPWHGVPVFSAWVADPEDVPDDDLDPAPT